MAVDIVDIVDAPQLFGYFRRKDTGQLADPTTVKFRMNEPDGVETIYVFGTNAQLEKTATGTFRVIWPVTKAGKHSYRFEGTGNVQAGGNQVFIARDVYEI